MLAFFVGPILFPKVPLFLLEIVSGIFPCKQSGFAITKQDVGPPLETTWVAQIHWNEMKVIQSCPTLCDPMDCSLPASSVHEILQARILEWVAIPFSRVSSPPRGKTQVSCIAGNFFTIWATREAPLIVLSKINLQFQGYSTSFLETYPQNCGSLCHSYSLVIM